MHPGNKLDYHAQTNRYNFAALQPTNLKLLSFCSVYSAENSNCFFLFLAASAFFLATSLFFLAASLFFLAASLFFLAASSFFLAASSFFLAVPLSF